MKFSLTWRIAVLACLFSAGSAYAQWQNQTMTLKPGWNAVFLHVDAAHDTLDNLVNVPGNPIAEIWQWQPPLTTVQFTDNPLNSSLPSSTWAQWKRTVVGVDTLVRLSGNAAYLVNNTNSVDFIWTVTGKPVPPRYEWSNQGLNLLGFSTPAVNPPNFDVFTTPAPELKSTMEVYRYQGGATPSPALLPSLIFPSVAVTRGQAFWVRASTNFYNRYFGPVEVTLQNSAGVHFSDSLGTYRVRLKNLTASARTVTMNLLASGTPPAGQPAIAGNTPLLVRGALNTTNLSYSHTVLNTQHSFTLAAGGLDGSTIEVVLGLNRTAMTAPAGSGYAGILRLADTEGLSQIDLPVTATVADSSGLWIGDASVTQVGHYLKTYQRDTNGQPVLSTLTTNGAPYVATATNTSLGSVSRPFPLRLIIHNNSPSNAVNLLQRVFVGQRFSTNVVVATKESVLDVGTIGSARRMTATHLPFALVNAPWPKTSGAFAQGSTLVFDVLTDHNDHASNPFLHTFHPDHDNLKADLRTVQVQGAESYTVARQMQLTFTAQGNDFAGLTAATRTFGGTYRETLSFRGLNGQSRDFTLTGTFVLYRVTPIATLTTN